MKKLVSLFLCLALVFSMVGCTSSKSDEPTGSTSTVVLKATIIEIAETHYIVEPVEGSLELKSASRFDIPIEKMETSKEPQVGDVLEITYNGGIMEVFPAQLEGIETIKLVDDKQD